MLVCSWSKLLPDLEDDLQGFPKKEISMTKILDLVCTVRSFENVNEEMLKNGYRVMHVKRTYST
jgi:hypothetical protein